VLSFFVGQFDDIFLFHGTCLLVVVSHLGSKFHAIYHFEL
jgi:hypothetical protein